MALECYGRTPALPSNAQCHITQGILENRAATQAPRLENKTNIQDFRTLRFENNLPDNLIWQWSEKWTPLELGIMFISLTLRSTWPHKSHMHIIFRKKNNMSKIIMQEYVGYRILRQWQVCKCSQNAALSTIKWHIWGTMSCGCYKFLRTVVLLPGEHTALLLYHYFHTLLKCDHQAGYWVLLCTQFGCDKKLNPNCCFAPHSKWATLHRDRCSRTTALL